MPPPVAPSCNVWPPLPQQVAEMKERYGSASRFLDIFTPELELQAARHTERAYLGTAPKLLAVVSGYGEDTAVVLLCLLLEDVNNFVGVRDKMPVKRQKELAGIFIAEYPGLKVTEFLLFFHRLKCGRYGRFYGMVDALFITSALLQFMEERHREVSYFKSLRVRQQAPVSHPSSTAMTYDEYLLLKKQKKSNHEKE